MATEQLTLSIGQQVSLPGHFDVPVVLEAARPLGKGFECRVRLPDGTLDETVLSADEAAALAGALPEADAKVPLANADQLRLLVESARIRLAIISDRLLSASSGRPRLPRKFPVSGRSRQRYFGVVAPNSPLRAAVTAFAPAARVNPRYAASAGTSWGWTSYPFKIAAQRRNRLGSR